jgi:hypothetical protein
MFLRLVCTLPFAGLPYLQCGLKAVRVRMESDIDITTTTNVTRHGRVNLATGKGAASRLGKQTATLQGAEIS